MEENSVKRVSHRRLTVCVIGSGGVGKSSITLRYINGHFPEVSFNDNCNYYYNYLLLQFYDPTIGKLETSIFSQQTT